MKVWSIITLLVFLNFTALPSIAGIFGFEIPSTNVVIQEEESSTCSIAYYEKTLPETLSVHDFIKFFETGFKTNNQFIDDESIYFDPHLSIFSPPPEV